MVITILSFIYMIIIFFSILVVSADANWDNLHEYPKVILKSLFWPVTLVLWFFA